MYFFEYIQFEFHLKANVITRVSLTEKLIEINFKRNRNGNM